VLQDFGSLPFANECNWLEWEAILKKGGCFMRISNIVLGEMRAPLRMPFKTALREVTELRELTVRIECPDGAFGVGSVVPTVAITGDSEAKILEDFQSITGQLINAAYVDSHEWQQSLNPSVPYSNSALCAFDIAMCDLMARRAAVPLWKWLGGVQARPLETNMTISVDTPEVMAFRAQEAVARGFSSLKIKVGMHAELDKERVVAIRKVIDPSVSLRLDANQGWGESEALELMNWFSIHCAPLDFIEQPVPAQQIAALARLTQGSNAVVVADESAMTYEQAAEVIRTSAATALSVKLSKAGGLLNAKKILDLALAHNVPCLMSCMFEAGAGLQAAVHLASVHPAVKWVDLDPLEYLTSVPYSGGAHFSGPHIRCSEGVGLAIDAL
jgi:L-Ala-D/L-Glu epimerase